MSLQQIRGTSYRVDNVNTTRLTVNSTATIKNLVVCNLQYDQLCPPTPGTYNWIVTDSKEQGEDGGDFYAPDGTGTWRTRDLNTLEGPLNGHVSLQNNQLSFEPGVYYIRVKAPAYRVWQHKARFQNVSLDATEAHGSSELAREDVSGSSLIEMFLTVTSDSHRYEVQHQCDTSQLVNGFGVASNFEDTPEIYTQVFISQLQ